MSLLPMLLSNLIIQHPEVELLRIRHRTRFTDLDLDAVTDRRWAEATTAWAGEPS
jgi:hypothetical protein